MIQVKADVALEVHAMPYYVIKSCVRWASGEGSATCPLCFVLVLL